VPLLREPSAPTLSARHHRLKNKTTPNSEMSPPSGTNCGSTAAVMHRGSTHEDPHVTFARSPISVPPSLNAEPALNYTTPPPSSPLGIMSLSNNKNRSSNDYVREMWPMAPPPGNAGPIMFDPEGALRSSPAHFLYGDSVTLSSMPTAGPDVMQPTLSTHRHSRQSASSSSMMDSEDDTHIYETPKYLRREKAATMKMRGTKALSQNYEVPPQGRGVSFADPQLAAHHAATYSRTLPREGANSSRRT